MDSQQELPRVVYDRYEVQVADYPSKKDSDWCPMKDDHPTIEEARQAMEDRRCERWWEYHRIVRITQTALEVMEPWHPTEEDFGPHETCPDDRDDLAPFSTQRK